MKLGKTYFSGSLTFDEGNNFIGPNTSVLTGSLSGSVKGTFEGSFAGDTLTNISGAFDAVSASIASDRLKNTTDTLTGDLTVTGTLTAQEFHTEYVSGSIIYESGSTKFGDSLDDTHEFTGSIFLTGSLKYNTPTLRIVGTSTDGSDDQAFFFAAGGDTSDSRGAYIWGRGNEATNGGRIQINAGNTATGDIQLYTGGSVRMYISSSGTIGVGTSNPLTNLLSIRGYGAIDSNANQGILISSNHYYSTEDKYIGNGYGSIISQDTGGTYAGYIRFQQAGLNSSGAGATMTLSDSMVIDQSGNLQIATTNLSGSGDPRVSVYSKGYYYDGSGNGLGDFHIGDGTYGLSTGVALGGGGAGDVRIWTTGGAHKLIFGTGGGDRVYLKSNGYLGLGVYDPSHKLQVLIGAGDGTGLGLLNTSGQGLKIFTDTTAANADVYIQQGATGAAMIFRQTTNERMRINSNGSVGIGTDNPIRKLHIQGDSISSDTPTLRISSTDSSGTNKFGIEFYSTNGADVRGKLLADNNGRVYIDDNGGGGVVLQTNGGTGNVGIGTTSMPTLLTLDASAENQSAPSQALRINGPNSPGNSNSAQQIVWAFDYAGSARIQAFREASWGTSMQFLTNAPAEGSDSPQVRLHIDESGHVGIGTTSPNAPLHVNGGVHFGPDSGVLNPSTGQVLIETASGGTPTLQFYPYGSSVMFLKSDGTTGVLGWNSGADREININNEGAGKILVGIGTGAPTKTLDVRTDDGVLIKGASGSVNGKLSFLPASGGRQYDFRNDGSSFVIHDASAGSDRMYFHYSGNVGIGTTSPSADLHINDGEGAAIVYQGSKRGKMIGKTIQRHTASSPKTDLFTINSFQSSNSNLYAVVTVLYVSPTSTNGGKMSAQFWIDNDNQSSPTVGSFTHEQQVGSATFSLEWDNTNKILKFVPASANYWYYVVDVEYVAFDGASVTFNTAHSYSET